MNVNSSRPGALQALSQRSKAICSHAKIGWVRHRRGGLPGVFEARALQERKAGQ